MGSEVNDLVEPKSTGRSRDKPFILPRCAGGVSASLWACARVRHVIKFMRYVLNYITWLAEFAPRIHGASTGVVRRVATSGLAVSRAAVPQGMASLSGRVGTPHYCPYRNIGKCSPVHFFWGSFVLAVTRFSGRPAPEHPGGVPHLPDWGGATPTLTKSPAPASGRVTQRLRIRPSTPRPTRNRRASRKRASSPTGPSPAGSCGSSSCPTRPCARPSCPTPRCWNSCRVPTRRRRTWDGGIGRPWNAPASPGRAADERPAPPRSRHPV